MWGHDVRYVMNLTLFRAAAPFASDDIIVFCVFLQLQLGLYIMHTRLQKYLAALDAMTKAHRLEDRHLYHAFSKTTTHAKLLLCELETTLVSAGAPIPDTISWKSVRYHGVTNQYVHDSIVLQNYIAYLRAWELAVRRL